MIKLFILATIMAANLAFSQVSSIPSAAGGGASTFDNVGSGTNTSATLTCGAGCTLVTTAGVFRLPNGTTAPATCTVGDAFFDTDATAGSNFYGCTATNTWTLMSGGGSGASYPTDLLCKLTVATTTATFASGASGSNTCNFAGTRISAASTLTITGTPAAGTYCFETDGATVYANLPGATTGLSASGMTMSASASCFTAGRTKIGKTTYTSGANWDSTVEDWRMIYGESQNPVAGTLMSSSDSGGNRTLNVDTTNLYATNYLRSTSGNDTYVAGTTPATTDYVRGRCYALDADTANTGASTVNIDSLGAKSILRRNGDALSDGDITANKPITVCYDGTQFIIQGDGGGSGATFSTSYGWTNFGVPTSHNSSYLVSTNGPLVRHWDNPGVTTIGRVAVSVSAAGGATEATRVGFYAAGCGTQIAESQAFNGTGTSTQYITFSSPVTLQPGTYCIMVGSNSATLTLSHNDWHSAILNPAHNNTTSRLGYCTNGMGGSGATATLPSSCGTINTGAYRFFNLLGLPQ